MEARLDFLMVRLQLRGPAKWVFLTIVVVLVAILVLRLSGR
jgi:hypothetical protein